MAQLVSDIIIVHINFPMVIISQNITYTYHDCWILISQTDSDKFIHLFGEMHHPDLLFLFDEKWSSRLLLLLP